jgi:hypothetical protein
MKEGTANDREAKRPDTAQPDDLSNDDSHGKSQRGYRRAAYA